MTRIRTIVVAVLLAASTFGIVRGSAPAQTGTWSSAGAIADSRMGAAAVPLGDGRTLIAGGTVAGGTATDTVVIFDPIAKSFTAAGQLLAARVGHTATLLADGRLLLTGGKIGSQISADVELFDPASGTSTLVALMGQPRTAHAAARLADGTVLIVGGATTDGAVLQSAEIFNPASGTVALLSSSLQRRRAGATATTLIDGRVLIAGGNDGTADLGSAEEYYPASQAFALVPTQLSVRRRGHTAVLLPHNNGVLVAGGTAAGQAVSAADLYLPAIFPDPFSLGVGEFVATGSMVTSRTGAVGGPAGEGYAFAAGGGPGDVETYRFATIKTDKVDYAPGERAVITGSGWQPGEEVTLLFQEDPAVHADYTFAVTADATGNIYWDRWAPEQHDLNVRFYLSATDSRSRAQTTFTDANSFSVSPATQSVAAGSTHNFSWTFTALNSANEATSTFTIPSTWTAPQTAAGSGQVTVTGCASGFTIGGSGGREITITQSGSAGNGKCASGQTLTITYSNVTVPTPATTPQTYTFLFDDIALNSPTVEVTAPPTVSVAVSPSSVAEDGAGSLQYTFTRTGTSGSITVNFSVGGTAAFNSDYTQTGAATFTSTTGTVTFSNGNSTATVTIDPSTDPTTEPDETVILTVVTGTGYTVGSPSSASGTITNDDNAAPTAAQQSVSTNEDSDVVVTLSGTDADGDTLSFIVTSLPTNGSLYQVLADNVTAGAQITTAPTTVTNAAHKVLFRPDPNENGSPYATFAFKVNDGTIDSDTATVTITVNAVNDPPVAVADTATTDEDVYVDINVITNDTDVDNANSQLSVASVSDVQGGTAVLQGDGRTVRFTPALNANSTTTPGGFSFKYTAKDTDNALSTAAMVSITVNAVNDPPVAVADTATTDEDVYVDINVITNDTDVDNANSQLSVANITDVQGGTALLQANGRTVRFTPALNANSTTTPGGFSFKYTTKDTDGAQSTVAMVSITVNAVNDPPVAVADTATTDEDVLVDINVIGNDTDVDNTNNQLLVASITDVQGGSAVLQGDGRTVRFTPALNANSTTTPGGFSFKYTAKDPDNALSNATTVTITVNAVNDAPILNAVGNKMVLEGSLLTFGVTASDVDGDTLTFSLVGAPAGATIIPLTGVFSWTPTDNGMATFTIRVSDGGSPQLTDEEQITVDVKNVAPTATFNTPLVTIGEGATFGISLSGPTDPSSADTAAGFKYAFDCGSGTFGALTSMSAVTCTAVDNPGVTVRGKIVDKDGGYTTYMAAVLIQNVSPAVTILTPPSGEIYAKGTSVPFTARVIDPGALDHYSYLWTFVSAGDSFSVSGSNAAGVMTINSPYSFPIPGVYNVMLTVTDKDGGVSTTNIVNNDLTAPAYVVIYDPSAGFVTGGGWVSSPAGASVEFPTAVGKASFGFVSKYQKGKTTTLELTGQTQFQFHAGAINFHSTSYDWLVVAGARAQFKGDGTINGSGDYGFILTAIDGAVAGGGGIDRFRIKIWDKATDAVVYDNQMAALDNDPVTGSGTIVQGTIVIHDPSKK